MAPAVALAGVLVPLARTVVRTLDGYRSPGGPRLGRLLPALEGRDVLAGQLGGGRPLVRDCPRLGVRRAAGRRLRRLVSPVDLLRRRAVEVARLRRLVLPVVSVRAVPLLLGARVCPVELGRHPGDGLGGGGLGVRRGVGGRTGEGAGAGGVLGGLGGRHNGLFLPVLFSAR